MAGKKMAKVRPNSFFAFQVYNSEIHEKVYNLQMDILKNEPLTYNSLIKVPTLHITLAIAKLSNEEDIATASEGLQNWYNENGKTFFEKPIKLTFSGVQSFSTRVLFVGIEKDENYQRLCDLAKQMDELLNSFGFSCKDQDVYNPHLTVLKLGYEAARNKKIIKPIFDKFKQNDVLFGEQEISHVQLLSMSEPKDENGYYKCFAQVNTSDKPPPKSDHSLCCSPIPVPDGFKMKNEMEENLSPTRNKSSILKEEEKKLKIDKDEWRRKIHEFTVDALTSAESKPDKKPEL